MSDWNPTHVAPAGGLPMWAAPDPAQAPVADLSEGTPVAIAQRQGAWAEVVCSNDFRAWVDGGRLIPAPASAPVAPTASASRRPLWIAVGAIALVIVIILIVASSRGSKKSATSGAASDIVQLHVPPGWSISEDGLLVVQDKADLDRGTALGPFVHATVSDPDGSIVDVMELVLDQSSDASITEPPSDTEVAGVAGVRTAYEQGGRIHRLVYVHPPGKKAVVFTLEAPSDQFASVERDLAVIPGLAP